MSAGGIHHVYYLVLVPEEADSSRKGKLTIIIIGAKTWEGKIMMAHSETRGLKRERERERERKDKR